LSDAGGAAASAFDRRRCGLEKRSHIGLDRFGAAEDEMGAASFDTSEENDAARLSREGGHGGSELRGPDVRHELDQELSIGAVAHPVFDLEQQELATDSVGSFPAFRSSWSLSAVGTSSASALLRTLARSNAETVARVIRRRAIPHRNSTLVPA
jgi:hypothetical protein